MTGLAAIRRRARAAGALAVLLASALAWRAGTAGGARALAATWERARFYVPARFNPAGTGPIGGRRDLRSIARALAFIPGGRRLPTVLYLHGCSGFGHSGSVNAMMLAGAGYMVVAPDSFARPGRIRTCDGRRHVTIVGRAANNRVRDMRVAEIRYAVARLRTLPWVDTDNLFLFGHSQGATAAAEYTGGEFTARILSGTRCTRGIGAPAGEPVLAVFSTHDPWFRNPHTRTCGERATNARVEVLELPGRDHLVARVPEARRAMLDFLARHRTPPGRP